jgi:hypothetical protein
MFVNTLVIIDIETGQTLEKQGFTYHGPVESLCGPSSGTKTAAGEVSNEAATQLAAYQTAIGQAGQIFGNSSSVFNDLMSSFSPVVAAGPNQPGYSQGQLQNLQSQAITQSGQAYQNAAQAAGERSAASAGGTQFLPSGANAAVQGNIAAQGASQTAGELSNINTNNAAIGRQNWLSAAGVLSGAPSVFNPSTSATGASTGAGQAAIGGAQSNFNTQNSLQQQNNWWPPLVGQAVGGVLGGVTGGLSSAIGGAISGGGGGPGQASLDSFTNSSAGMGTLASPSGTLAGANPITLNG